MSNEPEEVEHKIFDSAKELVIEGVNLYKRLKPLLKRKGKVKQNNDKSNTTNQ
jgi:hypothetical protein